MSCGLSVTNFLIPHKGTNFLRKWANVCFWLMGFVHDAMCKSVVHRQWNSARNEVQFSGIELSRVRGQWIISKNWKVDTFHFPFNRLNFISSYLFVTFPRNTSSVDIFCSSPSQHVTTTSDRSSTFAALKHLNTSGHCRTAMSVLLVCSKGSKSEWIQA